MMIIDSSQMAPSPPLFTIDALESPFQWISDLRKKYSPNSDVWRLRRYWTEVKDAMLVQLNDGS